MTSADTGSVKLLLYCVIILLVIGLILFLCVTPFIDAGIPSPDYSNSTFGNLSTSLLTTGHTIINTGNVFNITEISIGGWFILPSIDIPIPNIFKVFGEDGQKFLNDEVTALSFISPTILIPLFIIMLTCLFIATWILVAMLIP